MSFNRTQVAAAAALAAAITCTPASALVISGTGSTGVSFSGEILFNALNTAAELSISLTNTTAPAIGGYITGYAFDIGSGFSLTLASFSTPSFSTLLADASTSPFGTRDYAVVTNSQNPSWTGGGSPSRGLGVGQTGTWTFDVSPNGSDPITSDFVLRFRGLANGGSDKVPVSPIPEPSTYILMLAGLSAVAFVARRRRSG